MQGALLLVLRLLARDVSRSGDDHAHHGGRVYAFSLGQQQGRSVLGALLLASVPLREQQFPARLVLLPAANSQRLRLAQLPTNQR